MSLGRDVDNTEIFGQMAGQGWRVMTAGEGTGSWTVTASGSRPFLVHGIERYWTDLVQGQAAQQARAWALAALCLDDGEAGAATRVWLSGGSDVLPEAARRVLAGVSVPEGPTSELLASLRRPVRQEGTLFRVLVQEAVIVRERERLGNAIPPAMDLPQTQPLRVGRSRL